MWYEPQWDLKCNSDDRRRGDEQTPPSAFTLLTTRGMASGERLPTAGEGELAGCASPNPGSSSLRLN